MQIIWQALVDILSISWWHEGGYHKVDVGEHEEDGDWERGAEWWSPVLGITEDGERTEVEVD